MTVPVLPDSVLEKLCAVIADTNTGLTGSEIGRYLSQCGIADPEPTQTKRHRLYEALRKRQGEDRCANNLIAFLQASCNPVLYTDSPDEFERKRKQINSVLGFAGLELMDTGKVRTIQAVSNLTEAAKRADRLRYLLTERRVHVDVLKFCREELLVQNYFHVVLEATKSVAEKIRNLTGLTSDGADLADEAFSFKNRIPYLALNALQSHSEKAEQRGFTNLLKGLFGTFRNPAAHAPRLNWVMGEQDALDILAIVSLAHRRLDAAIPAHKISTNQASLLTPDPQRAPKTENTEQKKSYEEAPRLIKILDEEMVHLSSVFATYDQLYLSSEDDVELLSQSDPHFFYDLRPIYLHYISASVSRLLDSSTTGNRQNRQNLTISRVIDILKGDVNNNTACDLYGQLKTIKEGAGSLVGARNQLVSHLDLDVNNTNSEVRPIPSFTKDEFESFFKATSNLMNAIRDAFGMPENLYQPQANHGCGRKLIGNLREAQNQRLGKIDQLRAQKIRGFPSDC